MMFNKCAVLITMISISAGITLAGEVRNGNKGEQPKVNKKADPKAPSLEELTEIIQPMLANLALTTEQQKKVSGILSDQAWQDARDTFARERNREIFAEAHKKIPQLMPTVMMPRMMAYNMEKNMKARMAKQAGPPTPKEIEAIRSKTQKRMRSKLAPAIMGGLGDLTETRMHELLVDKKVLVRALAETISAGVLTNSQKHDFDKTLTESGYPKELIHGPDRVLAKRVVEKLERLAEEVIAELKKDDAAK